MSMSYEDFLRQKAQRDPDGGFAPVWMPDFLFDFQQYLAEWNLRRGRCATFADCGMGKTPLQLVVAENIVRHTNGNVLIATPLAVGPQTVREGAKFGIEARRSPDGKAHRGITVTNYERLHLFDPADFAGVICDESSILKNFDGVRRAAITEFLRTVSYRGLYTATPSPNDHTELGTSSEALGFLGHMDMLNRFFVNAQNTSDTRGHWRGHGAPRHFQGQQWRFKGHAEQPFWRWVCSWARACRKPSDLGFEDNGFALPPLNEREHVVEAKTLAPGTLFAMAATNMREERAERRRTLTERCEKAAALVADTGEPAVIWCHLNPEGDLLERMIPGSRQVSGTDSDEEKEEAYAAFADGSLRVLISKPKIGAWGLNWQHCAHVITFASHSWEAYYQEVRRCWRFGQLRPVTVDIVLSEGEQRIRENMQRKAAAADRMFAALVEHMNEALHLERAAAFTESVEVPAWL